MICSDGLKPDPISKLCASNYASVNLDTCEFSQDKGASELKTSWVDEEYDPNTETFYYLRVLENPTCRWSTWDAVKNNYAAREGIDKIIQQNEKLPSIWKMLKTPDIYLPLLCMFLIFLLAIYFRKKFFKQ